ncbi:MAG: amino acid ABC transporter substrate-binding protein [Chloroflexi bacterium]|nr:amino acid ABC transporter substrate-binding protein [Chloroflexota bacterium]
MHRKVFILMLGLLVLLVVLGACASGSQEKQLVTMEVTKEVTVIVTKEVPAAAAKSKLDVVMERGKLICGVNANLPGFGYLDQNGQYAGFDIDFCKALAAALFDDPSKVEYRPLTAKERFTAVQTGEVDVLIRNTTWTLSRDTSVGMDFAPTTFYDGQGIMVRKADNIKSLEDLQGATICVSTGTTTELNLADQMRAHGIDYTPVVFETADATFGAYEEGRCDAVTTDKSGLVSRKSLLKNPEEHVILDVTLSKEPLSPAVLQGDSKWLDVVKWVVFATFQAEEFGITSQNVDDFKNSDNPGIRRFLGLEGDLGKGLGLTNDFAYRVIKHVGNYAEIYDRNLGPNTPFNLPRGPNSLWTDGGLLYSPPFR